MSFHHCNTDSVLPNIHIINHRLREVTLDDAGEYECRAENSAGSTSLSASIDVQLAPIITITPPVEELKIREGDELSIQCTARGKPEPNVVIKPPHHQDTDPRHLSSYEGRGSANVHIYQAEVKHSGTYECIATSLAGTDSRFITIQVDKKRGDLGPHDNDRDYEEPDRPIRPPPPYDNNRPHQPQPQPPYYDRPQQHTYKAILGERSELLCNEASRGARTEWRRADGRRLPAGSIPRDGQLIIENTGHDATGLYDCVAHDIAASPTTIVQIMLQVIEPPRISFSPTMPMVVRSGETVTITCNATGEQPIRILWHGENMQYLPDRIRVSGQYLQFTQITQEDAGRYYCSASNRHGNVTKVAEVIVNREYFYEQDFFCLRPFYNADTHYLWAYRQRNDSRHSVSRPRTRSVPRIFNFPGLQTSRQPLLSGTYGIQALRSFLKSFITQRLFQYHWSRLDRPLPYNVRTEDRVLQLNYIRDEDAGRYECRMNYPNGSVAYDFVDVVIKGEYSPRNRRNQGARRWWESSRRTRK